MKICEFDGCQYRARYAARTNRPAAVVYTHLGVNFSPTAMRVCGIHRGVLARRGWLVAA